VTWVAPPKAAKVIAREALQRQKQLPKSRRGGLSRAEAGAAGITSGRARAESIARGELQPAEDIWAFFSRFRGTFLGAADKAWEQSKVQQAWDLWGGEPMWEAAAKALGKTMPNPGSVPLSSAPGWSLRTSPRRDGSTRVELLQHGQYRGDGVWDGRALRMRPGFMGASSLIAEAQLQLAGRSTYRNAGWAARKELASPTDTFREREAQVEREHQYWLGLQRRIDRARDEPQLAELARDAQYQRLRSSTIRSLIQEAIAERARFLGLLRAQASGAADARYFARLTSGQPTRMNPVAPRLEYISKNYNAGIVYLVAQAWLLAVGRDRAANDLYRTVEGVSGSWRDRWGDDIKGLAIDYATMPHATGEPPAASRFDRYLPWLAKTFNDLTKGSVKAMRKAVASIPDEAWEALEDRGFARERAQPTVLGLLREEPSNRKSIFYQLRDRPEVWDAGQRWLGETNPYLEDLVIRFRSVVDWAEAEGVDLNQYSAQEALDASEKWAEGREAGEVPQGRVIFQWTDGWTVQHLTTQAQLDAEGEAMQHCVADYYSPDDETTHIYSIRDPKGLPHVTIEWNADEGYMPQVKGKQNYEPKWEYLKRAIEFRAHELDRRPGIPTLEPLGYTPDFADSLKSNFLGAFTDGNTEFSVYGDGQLIDLEEFKSYAQSVEEDCRRFLQQEYGSAPRADLVQCVIATLDDVKPSDIPASDWPGELSEGQAWSLWKHTGEVPHTHDEMLIALHEATPEQKREAQALLSPGRAAANPQRIVPDARRARLKRRLMR